MSQSASLGGVDVREPAARPVDLHSDLYREIFVHSKEAIAIIDPDGYYLEQNGAHYLLLGYTDEELEGKTPAIHLGEQTFQEIAYRLGETGEYTGEVVCRTKGGEERNIELSAFAMRNGVGEPVCYIGIKRDITARKQSEAAIRRSESELTDFFETASIGLLWVGFEGEILRINQSELDLLGYTREEFVGRNIVAFHDDREASEDILQRLRQGEVLHNFEARLRCKDGSIKTVRIDSSAYFEDGRFVHSRWFTRDITDRRRTEHRLALQYAITRILSKSIDLVESTHEILRTVCQSLGWQLGALWVPDYQSSSLRCIDVWQTPSMNLTEFENVCRSRTFAKGEGLPGRIWATRKPAWIPDVTKDDSFPRSKVAERAGLRGAFGFPILLGDDVGGILEFFSRQIRQPDQEVLDMFGSVGGQIGQFQERKKTEEKLEDLLVRERAARNDSEKANRLKDEFLATLSHELRTPLNAIIGWARMLKSGRLDKESALHAQDVIERNAWSQKQIIEDILDVSRVITGKLRLHLGPVDLVTVVNAALDAVLPALEGKDIRIETVYAEGLRVISGDADRLQQVVWNLLSNASKFTPNGGKVEVRVTQEGAYAQVQIIDSGPGIAPEFLPHVFERFRQADGSTTRTHGGLGLGLAIVRHLVELHGGIIAADNSDAGSGAVFTVKLPLPTGELRLEALPALTTAKREEFAISDLKNLRILVVEDEPDALDLITMELTEHGARVHGATTAEEAVALLEKGNFDLLISDIGLADMDGYALIRQIRGQSDDKGRSIPAIALTAYARTQDRIQAIAAGYNTHVAKPVEIHELVAVVKCLTGRLDKG